jgi:hypothetical protein
LQLLAPEGHLQPTPSLTLNINQQIVHAVESAVIQNTQGTVNIGPSAVDILRLIERFGGHDTAALESALHEVEDTDARTPDRVTARQRLKGFLLHLGGKVEDAALAALFKYLETKVGM